MRRGICDALVHCAARLGVAAALALSTVSCADLSPLRSQACGNFVVEPDKEDCDGHAIEEGTTCAPPGDLHECRYTCSVAEAGDGSLKDSCPRGFGCGHDGVCRRASGSFGVLGGELPVLLVQKTRVGDFDGDGSPDLLALSDEDPLGRLSARVIYTPAAFDPTQILSLPTRVAETAVGRLDDDNTSDFAYADVSGVSIFRGRADHKTEFTPFPSVFLPDGASLRVIPLDVIPDDPGDEIVALIDYADVGAGLYQLNALVPAKKPLLPLPAGASALAGELRWGQLDEASPCPQIVLAYRGQSAVLVFTPCTSSGNKVGWNLGGQPVEITLPAGKAIDSGVMLVDIDLDKHLDLLIGASGDTFVAWGLGDGTFTSDKVGGQKNSAGLHTLPENVAQGARLPLAAQDLDADGHIDYVTPAGVMVWTPGGYKPAHENPGAPWTIAAVADFNDNGLADVIAGSSTALNLDFLNNAGGGVFNPSVLPTDGPPAFLTAGDFDGDLVNDIAYSQELDKPNRTLDLATVAFGAAHGPPASIIDDLEIEEIDQITAARLRPRHGSIDGISDLLLVSPTPSGNTDTMFVVHGSSARALNSALPLDTEGSSSSPIAMAVGRFGDPTDDLVVLGADMKTGELRLWRVNGFKLSSLDDFMPSSPLVGFHPADAESMSEFRYGAVIAAGDLNDDGTDEAVLVAPYGAEGQAAVAIADYDAATGRFSPRPELGVITATLTLDSTVALRDVDGDGRTDMVLLTGSDEEPGDVLVFWNDGHGGLDTSTPARVEIDGGAIGVGCLPSPTGLGCDLVIASSGAIYQARPTAARGFDVTGIANLPRISDVAVADFDRDGLADIAVTTPDGIQLYRSVPVLP